jgi:hypothetical protein
MFRSAQNDLYVVGWNDWGQTGQDRFEPIDAPVLVNVRIPCNESTLNFFFRLCWAKECNLFLLDGLIFSLLLVIDSSDRSVFLRQCLETGDVTGGGNRLGTGFDFDTSSPKAIDFKTEAQVIALESGHFHNLALTGQYRLF